MSSPARTARPAHASGDRASRHGAHELDVELAFDRFLGNDEFEILQRHMRDLLPVWSRDLRIWQSRGSKIPVDLVHPGALGSSVISVATARGTLYRHLVEQSGSPSPGSAVRLG